MSVSARPTPSGYIPTLDGWRAVAIALVIVSHQFGLAYCGKADGIACRIVTAGNPGVQLFFALSGFLICGRLLDDREITGSLHLRAFYIRRAFRILPAALTYLAAVAALAAAGVIVAGRAEIIASVLFARNYLPTDSGWYTGHFWSLAVEEHFYLLWPALLLIISVKRTGRIALGAAIAIMVWRSADARIHLSAHWFPPGVDFFRTDRRLDGLLAGCALAVAFRGVRWRAFAARWLPTPVLLTMLAAFILTRSLPAQVLLATLLVAGTVAAPNGMLGGVLEQAALRWVGRLSYSLYLWQELFSSPPTEPWSAWRRLPLSLVGTVLVAYLSYRLVERPFIRLGHRIAPPIREGHAEDHRPERAPARATASVGEVTMASEKCSLST